MEVAAYSGPIAVTLAFIGLYYGTILNVLRVKTAKYKAYRERGEKFDRYFHEDREMLAADRIQLNLLEHMSPFLSLLWMTALFVNVTWATWGGAVYLVARAAYPFLVGNRMGRAVGAAVMVSTFTGYGVLVAFAGVVAWRLVT